MTKREPRHDDIAHERQRRLAPLLLLANLAIAVCATAIMLGFDWGPDPTEAELALFTVLLGLSWATLLIAAGAVGWVVELLDGVGTPPEQAKPRIDARFLARYRMVFYYAGVLTNLAAFALVAEVTGGLAESPFVALLVAFVVTSQQLSRFKTQSVLMFLAGAAVVALVWALEPSASHPSEPAPHGVEIALVLLAFLGGGLLSIIEKPRNPRRAVESPSSTAT
jgi:hypothetical protein